MPRPYNPAKAPTKRAAHPQARPKMIKTFSLSVLFFLALGVMFAAYASVPV